MDVEAICPTYGEDVVYTAIVFAESVYRRRSTRLASRMVVPTVDEKLGENTVHTTCHSL